MADLEVITAEPAGADVLIKLREILTEAEKGVLSSVAIAVVYRDGSVNCAWSKAPSRPLQIGSVATLQWRLSHEMDGE